MGLSLNELHRIDFDQLTPDQRDYLDMYFFECQRDKVQSIVSFISEDIHECIDNHDPLDYNTIY